MRFLVTLLALLRVDSLSIGGPAAYFVDANSGSDNNDGSSPTSAFKTLKKMNRCVHQCVSAFFLRRGLRELLLVLCILCLSAEWCRVNRK